MTSANLNIVLTNALCCISAQAVKVSKLYSIGDKCSESELLKLKLMNDWFKALQCYRIDPIISKFRLKLTYSDYVGSLNPSSVNVRHDVIINNTTYSENGDGTTSILDMFKNILLDNIPTAVYNTEIDPNSKTNRYVYIIAEVLCDTTQLSAELRLISNNSLLGEFSYILSSPGECVPTNCLTDEQYEDILAKLMKECDICECQLTK